MSYERCGWTGCRRAVTHEATSADGRTGRYCLDHARGVAWTHEHGPLPDLDERQSAGVMAASIRFKEQMERLVKKGGITGVSIKAGGGDWVRIAGKDDE